MKALLLAALTRFWTWLTNVTPATADFVSTTTLASINRSLTTRGWEDGPVWKFPTKE